MRDCITAGRSLHGKVCHEELPPPGDRLQLVVWELSRGGPSSMLYAGLDLSRKRLDFHLLDAQGATVEVGAAPPDADGLRGLTQRLDRHGAPIRAAIESMNGGRFGHDRLPPAGWEGREPRA